jgi:AcrR family transcriptional regulator
MRTRDENKEKVIRQKALEMVVQEGFDGLSMQKLAKAAGVSPATIYIYFKHREDLIIQLAVEINNKITTATLKNFDPGMHLKEGLKVQWINRSKYCIKYPLDMKFIEQVRHSPFDAKVVKLMDKRFMHAMGDFVGNAIKRKELAQLPVEIYWAIAFAPLYILVEFHMNKSAFQPGRKFVLNDEVMNMALDRIVKALKP